MNSKELYKINKLNDFYREYNIDKEGLIKNKHNYFRFLCYSFIDFMRWIDLPTISSMSFKEAVLIEYRCFPHLEFLIRNTIFKLGEKWSHTVVCGNLNYTYMYEMCQRISPRIKVIQTNYDNLLPNEYNQLLTSSSFWKLFSGKKILLYQEDSILFKDAFSMEEFLQWDYIGAPFPKSQNDTPNSVGNGGFSLRTRDCMIEVIERISVKETIFETSTLHYMKNQKLTFPPEDVYFSKNMQDFNIGMVSDWDSAFTFSTESIVNPNSLGGHKFWISDSQWKKRMKKSFSYKKYTPNNNIREYLSFLSLESRFDKTSQISNAFDIDLYFCNYVHHIVENFNEKNVDHKKKIMQFIKKDGLKGKIYHPKQLKNLFPDSNLSLFSNKLFIEHNLQIYELKTFVNDYLYSLSYQEILKQMIKNKYNHLNTRFSLLLLVFIGNEKVGIDLIQKIITYQKIQDFNVAFCFNSRILYENFKIKIQQSFLYYSIYLSNEFGTDITPTMLMYDDICRKYCPEHIIKLHTKSIENHYQDLTNYLLQKPLNEILLRKNKYCNCIGHPNHYIYLNTDLFNKELLFETKPFLDTKKCFVGGTIFYCPNKVFKGTLEFIQKTNVHSYFFNNLYENNTINKDYSPIHFLERVFGIVSTF
jgi:hypothetical protein